jgi:hypothetical protein
MPNSFGVARCLARNSARHGGTCLIWLVYCYSQCLSSCGEVGELFVEDPEGARADRLGRSSTECVQAGGAGGVGSALEQVSGGGGVATRVGDVARLQLRGGEINEHKDARPPGGGRKVVECGG